jgi:23S rRNA pseudouridine1911/1915/1917 synthase
MENNLKKFGNGKNKSTSKHRLPIIYEDKDILVVDKPAGMLSVATEKAENNTAYRLMNDYVKSKHKSNRVWIVHRLDRDTSGVMLFAKNERIKLLLQENWEKIALERGYTAVVYGRVELPDGQTQGKITSWLKQNKAMKMYSVSSPMPDAKLAVTNYRVLQTSRNYSLLEITLETGRKNQIRVHMQDLGHSVVGDKKYAVSDSKTSQKANPLGRLGLHARILRIKHPCSGEEMTFETEIPREFGRALR